MYFLREGYERNQGRTNPGDDLKPQKVTGPSADPGAGRRRKTIISCNGYVDPETGRRMVAPGHKPREVVFTQDAPQTTRCDACQREFRSKYKMAHRKRRAKNISGEMALNRT